MTNRRRTPNSGQSQSSRPESDEASEFDIAVAWTYLRNAAENDVAQRGDKTLWLHISAAESLAVAHMANQKRREEALASADRIKELERELAAAQAVPAHVLGSPPVKPFEVVPDAADG